MRDRPDSRLGVRLIQAALGVGWAFMIGACSTVPPEPVTDDLDWSHPLNGREATVADLGNCTLHWLSSPMALATQRGVATAGGLVTRLVAERRHAAARRDHIDACMNALGYRRNLVEGGNWERGGGTAPARLTDEVDESTGARMLFVELQAAGHDWGIGLGFGCTGQTVFAMLVAPGIWDRDDSLVRMQFDSQPSDDHWFNRHADRERVVEGTSAGTGGVVLRGGAELLMRATRGSRLLVQVDQHAVLQFDLDAAREAFVDFYTRCANDFPRDVEGPVST